MMQLFAHCSVPYGDKPARGISIACGKCARIEKVHLNFLKSGGQDDDDKVATMARNKFEALGWRVGKSPSRHRCPDCIREARAAQMRFVHANKQTKEEAVTTVVELKPDKPAPHAEPPREMTRADGRLIFAKLEEAYGSERYQPGWTDERVAVDLGAPVAWVKAVREEFFGPTGSNPEIDRLLEEATTWREELVEVLKEQTALQEQTKKLIGRGEHIERRLADVLKAVGK